MKTIFKTIAVAAVIAALSTAGTFSAQASPNWGGHGIHSDVFQGD